MDWGGRIWRRYRSAAENIFDISVEFGFLVIKMKGVKKWHR